MSPIGTKRLDSKTNRFMKFSRYAVPILLILIFSFFLLSSQRCAQSSKVPANLVTLTNYSDMVVRSQTLLKEGKFLEANAAALQAASVNPKRFEAYLVAATAQAKGGNADQAKTYMDMALQRVPADKKEKLQAIADEMESGKTANKLGLPKALSLEQQRQYDALTLIIADADKATSPKERVKLLREFMAKSAEFLEGATFQANIWLVRCAAAVELDYPYSGWLAGKQLQAFGLEHSDNPKVRKLFAEMERKDWLGQKIKWRDWSKWTMDRAKAAALAGDEEAQDAMGHWYLYGQSGFPKDQNEAFKWYRRAAAQGNAYAQKMVGHMYADGIVISQDISQAFSWYKKAAYQGDPEAQRHLGDLYFPRAFGETVITPDLTQAFSWYSKAAAQGDSIALNQLGQMYENGLGVAKNSTQAIILYTKAAEQGNAEDQAIAEFHLGWMYDNGHGVKQDYVLAASWYRKLAGRGNAEAQYRLGTMYDFGHGVERDYTEAMNWYRKAAAQDHADANNKLGMMYEQGHGFSKNPEEAERWYKKAIAGGSDDAVTNLYNLKR